MLLEKLLADELETEIEKVTAAVKLLDDGATVPFIARYRKEATGGLTDRQLRQLEKRLEYLRELEQRKQTILHSIEQQDKLTETLKTTIQQITSKTDLEDLYLPYRPKRHTKAQKAKEAGLEPLLEAILSQAQQAPEALAQDYLSEKHNVDSTKAALEGAKHILVERLSDNPHLIKRCRTQLEKNSCLFSTLHPQKKEHTQDKKVAHFKDYFDYKEAYHKVPSHRALALLRGRKQGILQLKIDLDNTDQALHTCQKLLEDTLELNQRPANTPTANTNQHWLSTACHWAWRTKLHPKLEAELLATLKARSDEQAIDVFAENLRNLLLAAPAGNRVTLGLDPGLRTGVKAAITGKTGEVLTTGTIFPHEPQKQWKQALQQLQKWVEDYTVELIAIGNGTASRPTSKLIDELLKTIDRQPTKVIVSEAGASVYSASELADNELPDMDVSLRGAVSIARRLQDPLAELVKIEPKSIGVGQYQHDVDQTLLGKSLHNTIEDCVNAIGVDINTASVALLSQVSGINNTLANNIIRHRESNGPFQGRQELKQIPRFGDKTFELAAGFLRIPQGKHPLDASSVHPESYIVVENMSAAANTHLRDLIGNSTCIKTLKPESFICAEFGLPTIIDILAELEKPGRDPRSSFKTAQFRKDITTVEDLAIGMQLEGIVTNVTHFGAFVDIGLYEEGMVHISQLSDQFVSDPQKIVRTGDIVKVKVLETDTERKRIALTMKQNPNEKPAFNASKNKLSPTHQSNKKPKPKKKTSVNKPEKTFQNNTLAAAFNKAKSMKK